MTTPGSTAIIVTVPRGPPARSPSRSPRHRHGHRDTAFTYVAPDHHRGHTGRGPLAGLRPGWSSSAPTWATVTVGGTAATVTHARDRQRSPSRSRRPPPARSPSRSPPLAARPPTTQPSPTWPPPPSPRSHPPGALTGGNAVVVTGPTSQGPGPFGAANAATVTATGARPITATVTAESAGLVTVSVTTAGGTATDDTASPTWPPPTISTVTPAEGPLTRVAAGWSSRHPPHTATVTVGGKAATVTATGAQRRHRHRPRGARGHGHRLGHHRRGHGHRDISLHLPAAPAPPTAADKGYWEVASDGGLFAFGTAGSTARWAASPSTPRSWG